MGAYNKIELEEVSLKNMILCSEANDVEKVELRKEYIQIAE